MTLAAADSIAPAWLVLPLAIVTLLVVAGHVLALPSIPMPDSRRRIRLCNGVLMMLATPAAAYAFSIASPRHDPRGFVLSWMLVAGLLVIILTLAAADVLNTFRIHLRERRELRRQLHEAHKKVLEARQGHQNPDPAN